MFLERWSHRAVEIAVEKVDSDWEWRWALRVVMGVEGGEGGEVKQASSPALVYDMMRVGSLVFAAEERDTY